MMTRRAHVSACEPLRSPLHQVVSFGFAGDEETFAFVEGAGAVFAEDAQADRDVAGAGFAELAIEESGAQAAVLPVREDLQLDQVQAIRGAAQADGSDRYAVDLDDAHDGQRQTLLEPFVLSALVPAAELADDDVTVGRVVELAEKGVVGGCGRSCAHEARARFRTLAHRSG
jgi:hypothetical protein